MPATTCCSCKLHNGVVAVAGCLRCVCGRSITCSCKLHSPLCAKSSLQNRAFEQANERRVDPRTTLIRAACWHLPLFSACRRRKTFARRHKGCCKMTYSRMALSSRGPSSPRAAANRRDWHQASWWVMVELWMDKERPRPARVGGLITASAASPKV